MSNEHVRNWGVKKFRIVGYDDLPDDYIIDEDGKMVVMPTEELYDDGSDDDEEDSSDEEKKGALSGSADTRERRAVSDEFRRTGKGQGYDKLTTPSQVAAYRSSYGLGPAKSSGGSNPRPRPAPMPNRPVPPNQNRRPAPMPVYPVRRRNDPGFRQPAPDLRHRPAPMPTYRANETNDQGFMKSAQQSLRDPDGGLTAAGRKHFKETEGANLKPGVKGAADTPTKMRRKGSFLVRFFTNPTGPMVDPKGRPTRLALSARAWGEPVPRNLEDAAKLAAKGRRLLDRYRNSKEESKGQKSFEQFELSMKSADIPSRPHGGIRPSMPSGSFTGSPGGTNRGRVGETGTITASGRTTQRVYSGGRKNSRSLMAEGPNPSSYSRDKYFLVNESGNHPYDDSKGEYESQWDDEAEAMMPYDENEKSFDIPGRPHGGVAPKMPEGAWTGSPGGTTHRSGRNLPRTASGRMRQEMNNSNNLDDDTYPRNKYFLVTPDNKPFER
jgi:hypothetical protein